MRGGGGGGYGADDEGGGGASAADAGPTRVTPATVVSPTELRCESPADTYGLVDHHSPPLSPAARAAALASLPNTTSSRAAGDEATPLGAWGVPLLPASGRMHLVRFGVSLNGADVTLLSGEAPPYHPSVLTPPSPPPPTAPPPPSPPSAPPSAPNATVGGASATNATNATNATDATDAALAPNATAPDGGGNATNATGAALANATNATAADGPPANATTTPNATADGAPAVPPPPTVAATGDATVIGDAPWRRGTPTRSPSTRCRRSPRSNRPARHGGRRPVTLRGVGFGPQAAPPRAPAATTRRPPAARRFGGPSGEITDGAPDGDGAFVCKTPSWSARQPGVFPVEVSLNALTPRRPGFDWSGGRPGPILFTFGRPPTLSSVLPAGGPVDGGTRLYVRGTGLLAYARGAGAHCLLQAFADDESDAPASRLAARYANRTSRASLPTSQLARCVAPPARARTRRSSPSALPQRRRVPPRAPSGDGGDGGDGGGPRFAYYEPPTLVSSRRARGRSAARSSSLSSPSASAALAARATPYALRDARGARSRQDGVRAGVRGAATPGGLCGGPNLLNGQDFSPPLLPADGREGAAGGDAPPPAPLTYTYLCAAPSYTSAGECVSDPACGWCETGRVGVFEGPDALGGKCMAREGGAAACEAAPPHGEGGRWSQERALQVGTGGTGTAAGGGVFNGSVTPNQTLYYSLTVPLLPGRRSILTFSSAAARVPPRAEWRRRGGGRGGPRSRDARAAGAG